MRSVPISCEAHRRGGAAENLWAPGGAGREIPTAMPPLFRTAGTLPFEVHRRRRRTVGITVRDDGTVEVHAPLRTSQRQIDEVVEQYRDWIERKRKEHQERWRRLRARRFDDGDTIPFLGEELRLVVREVRAVPVAAPQREGETLVVEVPCGLAAGGRRAVTRYAVGRWVLEQAEEVFHRRHARAARLVGDSATEVTIKDMRSRWGSCGPSRKMSLNWRLVLAPVEILDYVLAHELVHIRVPDHSERFWKRVARACPHWEESRDWLRDHGADLEL